MCCGWYQVQKDFVFQKPPGYFVLLLLSKLKNDRKHGRAITLPSNVLFIMIIIIYYSKLTAGQHCTIPNNARTMIAHSEELCLFFYLFGTHHASCKTHSAAQAAKKQSHKLVGSLYPNQFYDFFCRVYSTLFTSEERSQLH